MKKTFDIIVKDPTNGKVGYCEVEANELAGAIITANMLFGTEAVEGVIIRSDNDVLKELQYFRDKEVSDQRTNKEIIDSLKAEKNELIAFMKSIFLIINSFKNFDSSTIGYKAFVKYEELMSKFKNQTTIPYSDEA